MVPHIIWKSIGGKDDDVTVFEVDGVNVRVDRRGIRAVGTQLLRAIEPMPLLSRLQDKVTLRGAEDPAAGVANVSHGEGVPVKGCDTSCGGALPNSGSRLCGGVEGAVIGFGQAVDGVHCAWGALDFEREEVKHQTRPQGCVPSRLGIPCTNAVGYTKERRGVNDSIVAVGNSAEKMSTLRPWYSGEIMGTEGVREGR